MLESKNILLALRGVQKEAFPLHVEDKEERILCQHPELNLLFCWL